MATIQEWRYAIHDEQVFCPRQGQDVDTINECSACPYFRSVDRVAGAEWLRCLPPQGASVAEMIEAVRGSSA